MTALQLQTKAEELKARLANTRVRMTGKQQLRWQTELSQTLAELAALEPMPLPGMTAERARHLQRISGEDFARETPADRARARAAAALTRYEQKAHTP